MNLLHLVLVYCIIDIVYKQQRGNNNMKKLLLLGVMTLGLTFGVNASPLSVSGNINYMISNSDDATGNPIMKAENNGSSIALDWADVLAEGSTGVSGFAKLQVGIDADDSGSDTFDSQLAYAGIDMGTLGEVSGGRQSHPHSGVSKTGIFNAYGGNTVFKYASRSSNSVKYSNSVGPISTDVMAVIDGATGTDGLDVVDGSASMDLGPVAVAAGYADDQVNSVKYTIVSGSTTIGGLEVAGTYSMKDAATDLEGMEATGSYTVDGVTLAIGWGDKEGTATYMTYGASADLSDSLLAYAEYQQTDNDGTAVDTNQMAFGLKYSF